MREVPLKVGTESHKFTVVAHLPTNDAEIATVSQTEAVRVRWACRAYRIELQEKSGARPFVKEMGDKATHEEVQAIVASYDPTVVRERGATGPRPPITLTSAEIKACKNDPVKIAALLAAKGLNVELVD